jgi:hypothetical protein
MSGIPKEKGLEAQGIVEYYDWTYHSKIQKDSSPWTEKRPWVG